MSSDVAAAARQIAGKPRSYKGLVALPIFVSNGKTCGSVACPAIGDAVVVSPGYAICLMYCVIRFCCRFAPDRGQATLLQGFMALPGFVSSAELVGASLLAIGDSVVVNLGHAICLKYRVIRFCCRCAPDRGQATLLQGFMALPEFVSNGKTCGSVACPAIGDAVVVNPGYAVCPMHRVIRSAAAARQIAGKPRSYKVMRRRRVSSQAKDL
ncbi:hypothetical protein [Pseudomonas sp. F3-2]|uniref:hypothetical protein n=1 Tax=Pseudomonas sp. F3-2 TaxID=3141539 RepID=UPI00315D8EE9